MSDEKKEEIEVQNGNGKYTIADEISDNIIKIMLVAFLLIGLGYCIMNFVGKDKGVDPNLVYGFFSGSIGTLIPTYFAIKNLKKDNVPPPTQ